MACPTRLTASPPRLFAANSAPSGWGSGVEDTGVTGATWKAPRTLPPIRLTHHRRIPITRRSGRVALSGAPAGPRATAGITGTPPKRFSAKGFSESSREAHLSTVEAGPQASARISRPHGDRGRSQGAGEPPRQGPQEAVRLTREPLVCRSCQHRYTDQATPNPNA
jgi:hypothetical protein